MYVCVCVCGCRLGDGSVVGQPTEGAILVAARKMGLNDPRETQYLREVELPFNPERKVR